MDLQSTLRWFDADDGSAYINLTNNATAEVDLKLLPCYTDLWFDVSTYNGLAYDNFAYFLLLPLEGHFVIHEEDKAEYWSKVR